MKSNYLNWINNKIKISDKLFKGVCGGTYTEAIIITCSLLSGIASLLWPGKGIDRKRFVELLINYSDPKLNANRISLPFMYQDQLDQGNVTSTKDLKEHFNKLESWVTEVYTGDELDVDEVEILKNITTIPLNKIREYSYANILYKEVRNGFIHEYRSSKLISTIPMTIRKADISYVNRADRKNNTNIHLVCYHYSWIKKITKSIISSTENLIENNQTLSRPVKWWVEG